jgi:hypothetical protein
MIEHQVKREARSAGVRRMKRRKLLLLAVGIPVATAALASDGAIEINAVKAAVGGVTPGDGAGFPVSLSLAGSYVLTGNLDPADPDTTAIEITVPNVTLDLGGFAIANSCGQACGAGAGFGVRSTAYGSTVRNGRVSGAGADGIALEASALVEDVDASFNVGAGIAVAQGRVRRVGATGNFGNGVTLSGGLLEDSELTNNGGKGASLGAGVGYARNVFTGNSVSVSGGHPIGGNVCSDKLCSVSGARRFYLTPIAAANGAAAGASCSAGFHIASIWEIHDPSALFYDVAHGATSLGSGQGVPAQTSGSPANDNVGWVLTGIDDATALPNAGLVNCHAYTTGSASARGTILRIHGDLSAASPQVPPWTSNTAGCNEPWKVWCVED